MRGATGRGHCRHEVCAVGLAGAGRRCKARPSVGFWAGWPLLDEKAFAARHLLPFSTLPHLPTSARFAASALPCLIPQHLLRRTFASPLPAHSQPCCSATLSCPTSACRLWRRCTRIVRMVRPSRWPSVQRTRGVKQVHATRATSLSPQLTYARLVCPAGSSSSRIVGRPRPNDRAVGWPTGVQMDGWSSGRLADWLGLGM